MKSLVIVESPTKAKTIGRFLGDNYSIKASMGHVMDLPKSKLGIDIEHKFTPEYQTLDDKKKVIAELKKEAKSAGSVILATDPDREGEAIAFQVAEILAGDKAATLKRIVFHEITKEAIEEALQNPRKINEDLVNAQTARRVLDRLVGYKLSPLLWKKVRRGLSAGRVQSIALRFIVEREREIEKFTKEPYFTITAILGTNNKKDPQVPFELYAIDQEKIEKQNKLLLFDGEYKYSSTIITTREQADEIVADLGKKEFVVTDVAKKQTKRSPGPPFTTSTLQQEASRRFGFAGRRTMNLAQKLYEEGFITYHRTDSVTLSGSALNMLRSYIKKEYGDKYVPEKPKFYTTKQKLAQEAHEAIRPTKADRKLEEVQTALGRDFAKLYEVILRRAVASQMSDALIESTSVTVETKGTGKVYTFKASGSVLLFDGFLRANPQALQDTKLPMYQKDEVLVREAIQPVPHETSPPPRYNDASLIATLEEKGIGRPSTYATIIATIEERRYIEREEKRFKPTPVGGAVTDFLVKNFEEVDSIDFTAEMEDKLDNIANGKEEWVSMMQTFYTPFEKKLGIVEGAERVKIPVEETNEKCPECGNPLVVRVGRFGKFLSCSTFPACKYTAPLVEETKLVCPKDGGKIIVKKTKKGRRFYGCSNYPKCDFAAWKLEDIKNATV